MLLSNAKKSSSASTEPKTSSNTIQILQALGRKHDPHRTNGNVLTVKKLLGHKRIENTMKYISMIHFKDDQFEVTTATNIEEAKKVLSAGFEYVTQKYGIMLFRRPKRFR